MRIARIALAGSLALTAGLGLLAPPAQAVGETGVASTFQATFTSGDGGSDACDQALEADGGTRACDDDEKRFSSGIPGD